jgi:outer membrane protein
MNPINTMCKKLLFVLFCLSIISVCKAQNRVITLNEAIKWGLENSKILRGSSAKLDMARSKVKQFWNTATIPNVTLNSGFTRLSDNIEPFLFKPPGAAEAVALNPQVLNQFTNRLQAQQIVYAGGRGNNYFKSAELLEKAATLDIDKDKIEVKNNIISTVLNLYKLQKSALILDENIKVMKGRFADVKSFVKAGTALENDALKTELAITQMETTQKEIVNALDLARFNLNLMLGQPTETLFDLDEKSLFSEKTLGSLDSYLTTLTTRPDLASADVRRQVAEKNIEITHGAIYPVVSLVAGYNENRPNQRVFPQQAEFKGTWDAGVQVSFNLSNLYTNKFQTQEARAALTQSEAQRAQLSDAAKMEIATTYYNYKTAIEKITLTEKSITQTLENQRVMKNRFEAQVSTIGEFLDADFLVLQAKLNLETARTDAEVAYYKLLKATGR